jgi:hypothetical protein
MQSAVIARQRRRTQQMLRRRLPEKEMRSLMEQKGTQISDVKKREKT